jgi:hypothetical protein
MNPRFLLPAALLAACCLAPTAARADMPGRQGQIVIRSDFDLSASYSKTSLPSSAPAGAKEPDAAIRLQLGPAVDYFVIPGLSVGGQVFLNYGKQGDSSSTGFGLGPRVGYYINFASGIGIWPQAAFQYASTKFTVKDAQGNEQSTSGSTSSVLVSAPLIVEFVDHFFLGIGPYLSLDVSVPDGQGKTTTLGIATQVGGYF